MKKRNIAQLKMAQTTLAVIHAGEHAEVQQGASTAWKKGVADADDLVNAIMGIGQILEGARGTSVAGKDKALEEMADRALTLASVLHALAVDHGQPDLAAATQFARSTLLRGSSPAVLGRCAEIHRWATDHLAMLGEDDVTETDVAALQASIESYQSLQTKPRKTTSDGKAANIELERLFGRLSAVLKERLDKLALKFKGASPKFYEAYRAARILVDPASAKARTPENPAPIAPPPPGPVPVPKAA